MIEWLLSFFLLAGAALMLLAAIGIVRLPDLPTRMHATTKSGVLGISLIMMAVALAFMRADISARALAIIVFVLLTAPVAAHVIGRAGYFVGVPLWDGTIKDDLHKHYNPETHELASPQPDEDKSA
ncbi:MAG TPA: monovalent cation/H(+) antiporter subunit G [Pseudomonadales bacterium]